LWGTLPLMMDLRFWKDTLNLTELLH